MIHLVAPFHNVPAQRFSTCAFASKALRFPAMMQAQGFDVVEYANEGSESTGVHVEILSEAERVGLFPRGTPDVGGSGWREFDRRLTAALRARVRPGDIVAHAYGASHAHLVTDIPKAVHVETGVGYLDKPFGAYRIFESHAWRHYQWGMADVTGLEYVEKKDRSKSWVIPMGFDPEEWPVGNGDGDEHGHYLLYMGRFVDWKGFAMIRDIIQHSRHRIKLAGVGDLTTWLEWFNDEERSRIEVLGPVLGKDRAPLVGGALAQLMPTNGTPEPFGAAGIEGMMAGTPLLASDWGAFTETVDEGVTGFRCRDLASYLTGIERCRLLDRRAVAERARERFSTAAVGPQMAAAFRQLSLEIEGKLAAVQDIGMSESQRRKDGLASVKDFAISRREQYHLTGVLANKEFSRPDRRMRDEALDELGVVELAEAMMNAPVPAEEWTAVDFETVCLSSQTIELCLRTLDVPLGGLQGMVLGRLEQRLLSLRDGTYRLPAGAGSEVSAPA